MALPSDVTTFRLTLGPYTDAAGEPVFAGMTGKIKPSFPQIRHVESGAVVIDSPIPVQIDGFGVASVQLAHTDQAILSPVGFTYSVVWDVASRKPSPGNKQFAVPTSAGAEVDFDLLAPSPDVEGVVVPLTYGKSAYDLAVENGFVGTEDAWLASLKGVPGVADDTTVAALIPGPGATATALRAAFVARLAPSTGNTATDTATIQTALTAAGAAGGGIVLLPADSLWTIGTTLAIPSNVQLRGQGVSTVLRAKVGLNAAVLTNSNHASGNAGIVVADLAVDGLRASQTADFATVDMWRVTDSQFLDLDVQGGRRQTGFPNGTDGEGLTLRAAERCTIRGGRFHDNDYDGIKLRRSNHNVVSDVVCDDNDRAGIQISFWSETGPPYSVGEGDNVLGSNHNAFSGITVRHSTGTPGAGAPITSGLYVHTGRFNTFSNFTIDGVRQGIGLIANASDNSFTNGTIRHRHATGATAAIALETHTAASSRNVFANIISRGLSGADGVHVTVASLCGLNRFLGIYFTRGDGTGTWVRTIAGNNTEFWSCFADGTYTDTSLGSLRMEASSDFNGNLALLGVPGSYGGGARVLGVLNAATVPTSNPVGGGLLYAEGGALKWRGSGGTVTTIGPA